MKKSFLIAAATLMLAIPASLEAQCCKQPSRLTVGGYGEIAFTRNFYSDSPYIYAKPSNYADSPGHGRFDVPHAVIYLGYDFGKGWTMQTEIEFEHTGTGVALEREYEEAGEFEQEIEKGGEVELEQFWLQKSFFPELNVRLGHIIVPVGGLNYAHEPLNFFTVYRPEGEYTIFPSTGHDTGVSLWGQSGAWRYEALMVAGLETILEDSGEFRVTNISSSGIRGREYHFGGVDADVVLVDPSIFAFCERDQAHKIIAENYNAPVVAVLTCALDEDSQRQFDAVISLGDSAGSIVKKVKNATFGDSGEPKTDESVLSAREKEVLVCVAKGMQNKEIADLFNISTHTVISHRKNISRKTGIRSIAGLTVYALLNNLLDINESVE